MANFYVYDVLCLWGVCMSVWSICCLWDVFSCMLSLIPPLLVVYGVRIYVWVCVVYFCFAILCVKSVICVNVEFCETEDIYVCELCSCVCLGLLYIDITVICVWWISVEEVMCADSYVCVYVCLNTCFCNTLYPFDTCMCVWVCMSVNGVFVRLLCWLVCVFMCVFVI